MTWNILNTARAFDRDGRAARSALLEAGCHITSVSGPLSESELVDQLQGADAVIASSDPYSAEVFARCPSLKLIARCGVGIDAIDLAAASQAGVLLTNTPGAMTEAVADYTLAMILALLRQLPASVRCMQDGEWNEFSGVELSGRVLGLLGFGQIGQAVARRAVGFGLRIIAHDPRWTAADALPQDLGLGNTVSLVDLDELFEASDIVSLHAPNMPETRHLVNADRLRRMRPHAVLVNTARGALIDEAALIAALNAGRIAGAALDVFEHEPLPKDDPLRSTPRLLLTPHNAFNTAEAVGRMTDLCGESILSLLRGERPARLCDPSVWESPQRRFQT